MINWDAAKKKAEAIDARRNAKSSAGVVTSSGTYNTPVNPLLPSAKSAQPKENPIIKALSRLGESSDTTLPTAAVKQSRESGYSSTGTLGSRLKNIFAGGLKSSAADYVSAGGAVLAAKGGTEMTPIYDEQISESLRDLEANRALLAREDLSDMERAEIQDQIKIIENRLNTYTKAYDANKESGAKLLDESSKAAQSAQESISAAKQGLGKVGSALVDVGVAGVQMGTDAAASLLTGGTISPLSATSARVFGSAAKAAIDNGATYEQAVNRGALAAITTYGISKLSSASSLAKKFAGKGASDTFAATVINKLADKLAKTPAGKAFIAQTGKLIVSGAGEDIEEMLEDAIAPTLDAVTYQGASGLSQYADADYYADMLYDGLIGGIIGFLGGTADVAASIGKTAVKGADTNAQTPAQSTALNNTSANPLNISQESAQALQSGFTAQDVKLPTEAQNAAEGVLEPVVESKPAAQPREQTGPHIDERVYSDVTSRKVNAFQFDNPELHEHYVVAAKDMQNNLRIGTKGERFGVKDADGYYVGSIGIKRSVSPEIETLLDNAKLTYAQIEKGLADLIADHGQENYAAAKKIELVLDDMLTNGYEVEGYQIEPDYEYIRKKEAIKSGEHSNEYAMTEDEWNALLKSEPATSPAQPAIFPENSLGAKLTQQSQQLPQGTGAASLGFDPYTQALNKYGAIPDGENPVRMVDVPKQTADNNRVSRGVRTALEAQATTDEAYGDIMDAVIEGKFSHIPITDKSAVAAAEQTIKNKGWENALKDWTADARSGKVSKNLIVLGQTLYNNAINAGQTKAGVDILVDLVKMSRSGAQATQANRVLKQLSPQYQLYALQRSVERINSEIQEKQKSKKAKNRNISDADNVPVEQWMERTGELLAKKLDKRVNGKVKAKTTAQTILADLTRFANQTVGSNKKQVDTRSELDRITDLFNNREHYMEAWDKAKSTIAEQYADNPDALAAFDDWFADTLDYTSKLTKELTGQSEIKIDKALAEEYLSAQTDEAREAVLEKIKDDIARQLPSSWYDKWNAWRYLSMLGNLRTHIRNIMGNAGFAPVRMLKSAIGTGIEKVVNPQQRTKAMLSLKDKPLKKLARADYDAVSDEVLGNGKYNDTIGDIERRKPIFNNKFLESARKYNDKALEVEDSWFSKPAYVNSLAGWYKANGITAEMLEGGKVSQDIIDKARAYAIREAQRATYRDSNSFSDWVARLGKNYTGNNAAAKAANVLVEGVLPFKRTPANILVRAVEYSPVGLAKGLTYDLAKVKSGEMEAWQAIDDISAGLTGTAIVGLGMLLASRELVTGGASDDDDEKALDNLEGKQNYTLNIGNKSYTIDWLAPEALPFFVGVELYNELSSENDEASVWDFIDKLSNISEPMFEMSMLQGVNDLIDSAKYSDSNGIAGMVGSAAVNYVSQGLPTLLGQIERTLEPERKTTYIDKTSDVPAETQYMLGKLSGKIPVWEYQQIPYKDALGRTESNGSVGKRIVNNFFNPSYVKSSAANDITEELRRLNDANALESVPTKPDTYFKYDGERHDLSGEDYSQFQSTRGKTASEIFTEVLQSGYYKKQMDDARRSQLVAEIFGFANDVAKKEYIGRGYESGKYEKVYEAQKQGIDPVDYFIYKDIEKQIDNNNSLSQVENAKAVNNVPGLSIAQKGALWTINNGKESDKNPFTGALSQQGFAPERCIEIMEARSIYGKKTEFVGWLSGQGYSQSQIDTIWEVYK